MSTKTNRLPSDMPKGLAGGAVDRSRPLSFSLNGRVAHGFAGDTVLSALLASGVDTIGTLDGHPLGLRLGAAPTIAPIAGVDDPQQALPMDRTLAKDGAEYAILADRPASGLLARLFQPGRTLGLVIAPDGSGLTPPWRGLRGIEQAPVDLLVIGGGVAGMSAALAGAIAGFKVTLVEASPQLGGHSGLFGTQDGESSPEDNIAHLAGEIAASDAITVHLATEVFAITQGLARAHQVDNSDLLAVARVIDLPARHIVIATGARERLPIFPGNRLPRVVGALEAFELAHRYGVWPGRSWLLATSSNPAYRLPILLDDSTIVLDRILDGRDQASSRYIEFCKAYGIRLFPGTMPRATSPARTGLGLDVALPQGETLTVERLVVCGGWQPDLTLWHIAGGASRWHRQGQHLAAYGQVEGIVLAGSAAGYLTRRGCITSGFDAVDRLLGRVGRGVDDPVIAAIHETPDGWMVSPEGDGAAAPAFLDCDRSLLARPIPVQRHWFSRLVDRRPRHSRVLSEAPQALDTGAICAGVMLGLIPAESAGIIAQERVALVALSSAPPQSSESPEAPPIVPPYLVGRFGPGERVLRLDHDQNRALSPGALVFASEDGVDARAALGVVLRHQDDETLALVAADCPHSVIVRDSGQAVAAEVAQPATERPA